MKKAFAAGFLATAAAPADRLVKLAHEGLSLGHASTHRTARLVGRGLGSKGAKGGGLNWNARVRMMW